MRRAREIAAQVGLTDLIGVRSGALGHGQQRKLEIAMTLATDPKLLLLDEPAAGLSPGERMHLADLLQGLDPAITIVLVEHDMDVAFRVAGKVTAIDGGRVIAEGTPDEISVNEQVQQVYLGMRRA
jgi:branched-chain amino acid transport system ATP-binding protein